MFALLIPLLASLPGFIGQFFKSKNDLLTAQNNTNLQIELAKISLATEMAKAQMEVQNTVLQSTGSYFKYFTFFMWFGPFMLGVVAPVYSKVIFMNLATMPDWYVQSCMLIMFTVWGISVSADTVGGIFANLAKYFDQKREKGLPAKMFFDTLRSVKGNISQNEVDLYNKALDALNKGEDGQ